MVILEVSRKKQIISLSTGTPDPSKIAPGNLKTWFRVNDDVGAYSVDDEITTLTNKVSGDSFTIGSSAGRYPLYKEISGVGAALYDGTDDRLFTATKSKFNHLHQGSNTHVIVFRPTSVTTTQILFDNENFSSSNIGCHASIFNPGRTANTIGNAGSVAAATSGNNAITTGNTYIWLSRYDNSIGIGNEAMQLEIDNTEIATSNKLKAPSASDSTNNPTYGAEADLTGSYNSGYMFEMISWDKALTASETSQLISYTNSTYGS